MAEGVALLSKAKLICSVFLSVLFGAALYGQDVNFQSEILPIFREHCFECHGGGRTEGGLSLESVAGMQRGGHSGSPIFTEKATDSELYLRVSSLAENYRMPKRGELLPQSKISTISKWIYQNAELANVNPPETPVQAPVVTTPKVDWSAPTNSTPDTGPRPSDTNPSTIPATSSRSSAFENEYAQSTVAAAAEAEGFLREYGITNFFAVVVSTAFVTFALCWFYYRVVISSSKKTQRRIARNDDVSTSFLAMLLGAITCVMFVGLVFLYMRASQLTLENEILRSGKSRSQTSETSHIGTAPLIVVDANNLPLPPHPMHPPRLGGEYYRGNDERDTELFNGGFYRTATIDLHLVNSADERLRWGDSVEEPLFVEIQIQRAAKATRELFTNRIAGLSSIEHYSQQPSRVEKKLKFEVLKDEDLWSVKVPLSDLSQVARKQHLEGMVYLMYGTQPSQSQLPRPHFAVKYDLHFEADETSNASALQIRSDSVLWMGSMYTLNNRVLVPNSEQVLLDRWFDWRPIPEIEGDPTKDASLIGTGEHLGG